MSAVPSLPTGLIARFAAAGNLRAAPRSIAAAKRRLPANL